MLSESLRDRLVTWFHKEAYQESDRQLIVKEPKKAGEAEVTVTLQRYSIAFNNMEKSRLSCFKNAKCADGIIFEQLNDGNWNLHVMECKRTMKADEWEKTKQQFEGAILNAHALAGVLGIQGFSNIYCYTAFRHDRLTPASSPDPVFAKLLVGVPTTASPSFDWEKDRVKILSLPRVQHKKVQLDPATGTGTTELLQVIV